MGLLYLIYVATVIRSVTMGGQCSRKGIYEKCVSCVPPAEVSDGGRQVGRPKGCRFEENIKIDVKERVKTCRMDPFGLDHGPVAGCCEVGNEHGNVIL